MSGLIKKIGYIFLSKILPSHKKTKQPLSATELNSQEVAEAHWSDPAILKKFFSPSIQKFNEEIISIIRLHDIKPEGKKIADVGCGTGQLLKSLAASFSPSYCLGLDFSNSALQVAKNVFPEACYKQHNIYEPLNNDRFYLITCTEVIEHLLDPDIAFSNLLTMLEGSGWLLVTVPDGRKDTFDGHINFWSPESWERFVVKNTNNYQCTFGKIGKQNLYALIKKPL